MRVCRPCISKSFPDRTSEAMIVEREKLLEHCRQHCDPTYIENQSLSSFSGSTRYSASLITFFTALAIPPCSLLLPLLHHFPSSRNRSRSLFQPFDSTTTLQDLGPHGPPSSDQPQKLTKGHNQTNLSRKSETNRQTFSALWRSRFQSSFVDALAPHPPSLFYLFFLCPWLPISQLARFASSTQTDADHRSQLRLVWRGEKPRGQIL